MLQTAVKEVKIRPFPPRLHGEYVLIDCSTPYAAAIVQGGVQDAGNGEETEPFYFKLLCPQGITGLIIGKGGANIIQLNATTGARIKLSQNNEYFPNTTDRILLSKLMQQLPLLNAQY
jgi:hypothetical protein